VQDKNALNEQALLLDTCTLIKDERGLDTVGVPVSVISGIPERNYSALSITVESDYKLKTPTGSL